MKFLVIFILTAHALLSLGSAWRESLTYDEIFYKEEGVAILTRGAYLDPYGPPLTKILTGIPFVLKLDRFVPSVRPGQKAIAGRIITILFSATLLYGIYLVALAWFGPTPAVLAIILAGFEPNILGHNHYLTSDVPFALFYFLTWISFVALVRRITMQNVFFTGVSLGLAMATKIPALGYFLVSAIILLLYKRWVSRYWKYLVLIMGIALGVVWATYGFGWRVVIAQRNDSARVSEKLIRFAASHKLPGVIEGIRILQTKALPLGDYAAIVKNSVLRGLAQRDQKWYAMLVTIFRKTPIPLLAFVMIGLLQQNRRIFFVLPIVTMVTLMHLTNLIPWIRYALPLYPFMILLACESVSMLQTKLQKLVFALLVGWYIWGTLSFFPHFISYANELAGPRERLFEKFSDSNIDWGQSLPDLATYVEKRKPTLLLLSYFGRDDAGAYGFASAIPWGDYRFEQICAFHPVQYQVAHGPTLIAISISNWHGCGYSKLDRFSESRIRTVVGDAIFIFD